MQQNNQTSRFVYIKKLTDSRHFTPPSPLTPPSLSSSYELIGNPVTLLYPSGFSEKFPLAQPKKFDYSPLDDLKATCEFIAKECVKSTRLQRVSSNLIKACRQGKYEMIQSFAETFNTIMNELIATNLVSNPRVDPKASHELVCHVLEQAYCRTVSLKSHILREYEVLIR
jgi:hypothetical protein